MRFLTATLPAKKSVGNGAQRFDKQGEIGGKYGTVPLV